MWVKGELFDDLDAVARAAQDRLDRAHQSRLFDRLEWFRLLWRHCPPGKMPLVARARAENAEAWLFLARTAPHRATALANWYTLGFRPVFWGDPPEATRRALLQAIAKRLKPGLAAIELMPVPEREGMADIIVAAFRRAGWIAFKRPKDGNWLAETKGGSFEDYWAARPGNLRSTLDRKSKKFDVETRVYTSFDEAAWEEYEQVYGRSWKSEEGAPAFLKALAEREGAAGALRLGIARFEGRPVAAQFWTCDHDRAIIHKLAYVEEVREMSAGTILSAAMFRHAIDTDKVAKIDFGTGDDSYKTDWMEWRDELHRIMIFNPASLSGLLGAGREALSHLYHRLLGR
jgi:hypothetical protein